MRISIVAVSRRRPSWLKDGIDEYLKRLPPEIKLRIIDVTPGQPRPGEPPARLLTQEADRIRTALPKGSQCIVLDEKGRRQDTRALARSLERWRMEGMEPAFVIGGAEGTDTALRESAAAVWSLSPLTLPHGLALLVLVEQIYRAGTILDGHPYHRD